MRKWTKKALTWGPPGLAGLALLGYLVLPWPVRLRWSDPETTSFMRYRVKEARRAGETLELRHDWVPLERISPNVVRAVVLAEDARFREHKGVDWSALAEEVRYDGEPPFSWFHPSDLKALLRAARYYWGHRDELRGRSTITQQLAKNLYFTPDRSLARKLAELAVAQRLEWFLTKDRILELYLNTVELGPGVFGVEAAAREYFGASAGGLTAHQAASLAGTLPHPLTSNPARSPGRMAWRRDLILGRMAGRSRDLTPVPDAPPIPEPPAAVRVDVDVPPPDTVADTVTAPPPPPDTLAPPPPPPDTGRPPPDTLAPPQPPPQPPPPTRPPPDTGRPPPDTLPSASER